jgi:hypothetical protein
LLKENKQARNEKLTKPERSERMKTYKKTLNKLNKLSPAPDAIKVSAKVFSLIPHQKRSISSVFKVFTLALYKANEI